MSGENPESPKSFSSEVHKNIESGIERIPTAEIMRTPGIRFAVIGCGIGLTTAVDITVTKQPDGSVAYTRPSKAYSVEWERMIEKRSYFQYDINDPEKDIETPVMFDHELGGYRYRLVVAPGKDEVGRRGFRGVLVGWSLQDRNLDQRMRNTIPIANEGAEALLEIWKNIYAQDNLWDRKFTDPQNKMVKDKNGNYIQTTEQRKIYFEPPQV